MEERTKYRIAIGVVIVAIGITLNGYMRVQREAFSGHVSKGSFAILIGGALLGIAASIAMTYLRSRVGKPSNPLEAEVKILAQLGKDKKNKK